ncbi:hypothetical protein BsWGS_27284 [Bradybaena similaris]
MANARKNKAPDQNPPPAQNPPPNQPNVNNGPENRSTARKITDTVQQWLSDVMSVLERPGVAIAVFFIGVVFIILASKQVRMIFDYLELWGLAAKIQPSFLNNFTVPFVLAVVWLNVVGVTTVTRWLIIFAKRLWRWAVGFQAFMREMDGRASGS